MTETICAVVVTYNRKELLGESLDALLAQTRPVDKILVVDNASTDGTPEFLQQKGYLTRSQIIHLRLPQNVGGAGGFHEGVKQAFDAQFDWIWVLDDDSIASPDALEQLLTARQQFDESHRPDLLASKVVWTDGSLHPMNEPTLKTWDMESAVLAAQYATISIRTATFVSLLLHRRLIKRYGLPWADYFIWGDDTEYTARILRYELGVWVPASRVLHKTARKHTFKDDPGPRSFYHFRNSVWMQRHSDAWTKEEKLRKKFLIFKHIWLYLIRSRLKYSTVRAVFGGLLSGFFTWPQK